MQWIRKEDSILVAPADSPLGIRSPLSLGRQAMRFPAGGDSPSSFLPARVWSRGPTRLTGFRADIQRFTGLCESALFRAARQSLNESRLSAAEL